MFDIYLGLRNSIVTHSCQRCSMGAELATWHVSTEKGGGGGGGGPDVVHLPWGISSITHTTGGGKKGERKGEENEWVRNKGKQEAETLQHNAPRVSCRLRQIRNNTAKRFFFTPTHFPISKSYNSHTTVLHYTCDSEGQITCIRVSFLFLQLFYPSCEVNVSVLHGVRGQVRE